MKDNIKIFHDNNSLYGLVNTITHKELKAEYKKVVLEDNYIFIKNSKGLWAIFNKNLSPLTGFEFEELKMSHMKIIFKKNRKYGLMNSDLQVITRNIYEFLELNNNMEILTVSLWDRVFSFKIGDSVIKKVYAFFINNKIEPMDKYNVPRTKYEYQLMVWEILEVYTYVLKCYLPQEYKKDSLSNIGQIFVYIDTNKERINPLLYKYLELVDNNVSINEINFGGFDS